jgi:hypothetical protein
MPDAPAVGQAVVEIVSPDDSRRSAAIAESPFSIGRGEAGNHLQIPDPRISRACAAILFEEGRYFLEDRGHRLGVFINGERIAKKTLREGDVVTFGLEDSYKIIFHAPEKVVATVTASASAATAETTVASTAPTNDTIEDFLTRIGRVTSGELSSTGLSKLNLLLEATKLLHSQLPLDAVLESMLDHAIAITNAERGLLLEADASGSLRQRLARRTGNKSMTADSFSPTKTALRLAVESQSGVITEDLHLADVALKGAESIVAQGLRAIVAIPLYAMPRANTTESILHAKRGQFLGVLYLDSRRPAAFSKLDRQILDVFWTMRAWWIASASASGSSRN